MKKSVLASLVVTLSLGLCMQAVAGHKKTAPATEGAEVGVWTQDYDAAKKLAAEKKLPLFLNFTGSDWCGWCKLMDKEIFSETKWKNWAKKNIVLVWIDSPRDKSLVPEKYVARNRQLMDSFGVRGFPTYIVLDSDGVTKKGQLGASRDANPKDFIKELEAVIASKTPVGPRL